jgi:hypothetical protein
LIRFFVFRTLFYKNSVRAFTARGLRENPKVNPFFSTNSPANVFVRALLVLDVKYKRHLSLL